GKAHAEQLGIDPPRPHLAQPRCVHHVARSRPPGPPAGERDEQRRTGRVLPRAPFLADLPDPEIQARIKRVQEARLPHPGRPREHRLPPARSVAQRREPPPRAYPHPRPPRPTLLAPPPPPAPPVGTSRSTTSPATTRSPS